MSKTKKLSLAFLVVVAVLALVAGTLGIASFASADDSGAVTAATCAVTKAVDDAEKYLTESLSITGGDVNFQINANVTVKGIAPSDYSGTIKITQIANGVTLTTSEKLDNGIFQLYKDAQGNYIGVDRTYYSGSKTYCYERVGKDGYVVVATTNDSPHYTSVAEAIAAGQTNLRLLCNLTESVVIPNGANVQLDLKRYLPCRYNRMAQCP